MARRDPSARPRGQPGRDRPPGHPGRPRRRAARRWPSTRRTTPPARTSARPTPPCCCPARRSPRPTSTPAALVRRGAGGGRRRAPPGYGFLSENPALPEACAAAGIVWVGPPPEAMRVMGHKARAKEVVAAAGRAGAARVPWWRPRATRRGAGGRRGGVGYPLLVKASAGGGGRGMRLVRGPGELADAVAVGAARGRRRLRLRRGLPGALPGRSPPRRGAGRRRHPRHGAAPLRPGVLGAAPAPEGGRGGAGRPGARRRPGATCGTPPSPRRGPSTTSARARSSTWSTASGFYFLEMNTRLQVEHGVTELVTGLDLVGLQLAVAAGRPLPFGQAEVAVDGPRRRGPPVRRAAPGGLPADPGHGRATCAGPRVPACAPTAASSPAASSAPPTTRWWPSSWPTAGTAPRRSPSCPWPCARSSSTASRPTGTCSARCSTTRRSARGEADIHYLERRPDLRDAALPDAVRRRHGRRGGVLPAGERAAAQPGPGARGGVAQRRAARCTPTS